MYILKRKATDRIRLKYGSFYQYVKGITHIRKENSSDRVFKMGWGETDFAGPVLELGLSAALNAPIADSPTRTLRGRDEWADLMKEFLHLITPGRKTEEEKTDDFYKAFLLLMTDCLMGDFRRDMDMKRNSAGNFLTFEVTAPLQMLDRLLFSWYADEAFEWVEDERRHRIAYAMWLTDDQLARARQEMKKRVSPKA
jgi:hypothetical protein